MNYLWLSHGNVSLGMETSGSEHRMYMLGILERTNYLSRRLSFPFLAPAPAQHQAALGGGHGHGG